MPLALKLSATQQDKSARHLMQLLSEIFQNFLTGPYHEYSIVHLGLPEV